MHLGLIGLFALSILAAAACGGDEPKPGKLSDKLRDMTADVQSAFDQVCSCPNLTISAAECKTQVGDRLKPMLEAFTCLADVTEGRADNRSFEIAMDCVVGKVGSYSDCIVAADCDTQKILDCQRHTDSIDTCPDADVPSDLEFAASTCLNQ